MMLSDVCLTSVAYIGPKSRTVRPRKTKIGTEVAHIICDSDTTFKIKRSKVKVTGAGAYCGGLVHSLLNSDCWCTEGNEERAGDGSNVCDAVCRHGPATSAARGPLRGRVQTADVGTHEGTCGRAVRRQRGTQALRRFHDRRGRRNRVDRKCRHTRCCPLDCFLPSVENVCLHRNSWFSFVIFSPHF